MSGWEGLKAKPSKSWLCSFCSNRVASSSGWDHMSKNRQVRICPQCGSATYFAEGVQHPKGLPGTAIKHLPKDVEALYSEVRTAEAANAPTAAILAARKILMHVAVEKGAKAGLSFVGYVDFLEAAHYIPPAGKHWVDHIRKKSNEANHEVVVMSVPDAEELRALVTMLLQIVYEFPNRIPPPSP